MDLIWWPPWHSSSPKPWKSNRFFWWWMFHGVPLLWFFLLLLQHSIPGYLTANMPAPKWARFESLKRSSLLTVFPLTMIKTCCGWDGHATILISCRLCYAPLSPGTVWSYFLLTIKPDLGLQGRSAWRTCRASFMEVLWAFHGSPGSVLGTCHVGSHLVPRPGG